ncbi:MAG: FtsQ-type POTRA domain-containing protein [Christensenella sp.]|nr:FtsQ-type POTRA domain-containing protein [Christensenella sp.]
MKDERRQRGVGKKVLAVVLAILILAGAGYFIYVYFQVENVTVSGNSAFDTSSIVKLADIQPKTHMFLVDADEIAQKIEQEPYLKVNSVIKQYPKTIAIDVSERQPKALVEYAGQYLLIDGEANVLEILNEKPEVQYPVVTGIAADSVSLGKPIDTQDSFKISVLSDLLAELESKELFSKIASIDLSNINSIQMKSYEGMDIRFGQSDKIPEKMKLIKRMLPKLAADGNTSGIFDVSSGTSATYRMSDNAAPVEDSAGTPTE